MSNPVEPSDSAKPVVAGKNPHNYRKVGYSMIVISVSLVLIGLLVWAIGDNYHFASDIMAGQEVDAFTPKSGYNLVVFDYTQPVGAKLKFLDHASNMDDAIKLQTQYAQQNQDPHVQILIFDSVRENTTNSIALAEVYAMTPSSGFNVISDNTALPVGAKLSSLKHDDSPDNATKDVQFYQDQIKDPAIKIVSLTSSYDDNLHQILGPNFNQNVTLKNLNKFVVLPPPPSPPKPVTTNVTSVSIPVTATVAITTNGTSATSANKTSATIPMNATAVISIQSQNQTGTAPEIANQTNLPTNSSSNNGTIKNVSLSESISIDATTPNK